MAVQQHPFAGEAQHRVAPGRVDPLVGARCRRRSRRRRRSPAPPPARPSTPATRRVISPVYTGPITTRPGEPLGVAQRVGDRRVGPHRVPGEDESLLLPHLRRDHPLQVADQPRVSITLPRRRRIGLAVAAGVVGDDSVPGPLQRPRAVDDVAPGGGDAVAEDDRRALPRDSPRAGSAPGRRTNGCRARRPPISRARRRRLEVVDRLVGEAGERHLAVADRRPPRRRRRSPAARSAPPARRRRGRPTCPRRRAAAR